MYFSKFSILVLAGIALSSCRSEQPVLENPAREARLQVRNAHALAYDLARDRIVLFGGANDSLVCSDTWEWHNGRWQRKAQTGPPARTFPAMCADPVNGGALLFGGNRVLFGTEDLRDTFLNDFWRWDGQNWHEISGMGPAARAEASMVFDTERNRLVLFGGYNRERDRVNRLRDTWEWDGEKWQLVSDTGPAPQSGATMIYDEKRAAIVLFGQNSERTAGEVWQWSGNNWKMLPEGSGSRRYNAAIAYAPEHGYALRFGGWNGEARTNDSWIFDETGWRLLAAEGPSARNHSAMVYDHKNRRFILFGGHDGERVFGDMWAFKSETWHQLRASVPKLRIENGH